MLRSWLSGNYGLMCSYLSSWRRISSAGFVECNDWRRETCVVTTDVLYRLYIVRYNLAILLWPGLAAG